MEKYTECELSILIGETIIQIELSRNEITFHCISGFQVRMNHQQECYESVWIEDITGDLNGLIGNPILQAECVSNESHTEENYYKCTFYKLATIKEYVTLRWLGESNGYYACDVIVTALIKDFSLA